MISIIIPFYNENKNIPILLREIEEVASKQHNEFEVVLVDDGSEMNEGLRMMNDAIQLKKDEQGNSNLHKHISIQIVRHRKRFGKGEALQTGIKQAKGDVLIFMDGDLQDDPHDIPVFVKKLDEGYDLINGVRINRKDNTLVKLYSRIVNMVLRSFMKSPFTDINCGFKIFKREILKEFTLYGNNFRFLPLATYNNGFKVAEVTVKNRSRIHGVSKFGSGKLLLGIMDTLTAYFLFKFNEKPLHFFGSVGGVLFFIGFAISLYLAVERIFFGIMLYRRPLLQLGILLIIVGIQIIMTGIIGELVVYVNRKKV